MLINKTSIIFSSSNAGLRADGRLAMEDLKNCDYCGDLLFIGSRIYEHTGDVICEDCAPKYAWMLFEMKARLCYAQPRRLIAIDKEEKL